MLDQHSSQSAQGLVNGYNRPNAKWECGHLSSGCPCSIGPTAKGKCSGGASCYPAKNGDSWTCSRPEHQGGKCEKGPQPDGSCCQVRSCTPNLSLRYRRRMIAFSCAWIVVGGLLMLWGSGNTNEALVPGPLSSSHAQLLMHKGNDRCASCHPAAHNNIGDWIQSTLTGKPLLVDGKTQSQMCLECHKANIDPEWSLSAHNLTDQQKADLRANKVSASGNKSTNVNIQTAGFSLSNAFKIDKDKPQSCSSCHQEHHGTGTLVDLSNKRCVSCHQEDTTCFESNHPPFRKWPAKITKSIQFNHPSHFYKHFPTAKKKFDCLGCHKTDEDGNVMKVDSFQKACAECHSQQINQSSAQGWALIQLPMLDLDALKDAGIPFGSWPEDMQGDFDGKIPAWTRLLLQADKDLGSALTHIGPEMELIDVDPEKESDLQAAAKIGKGLKRLLLDLAVRGRVGIRNRLEIVLKRPLTETELKQLGYGFSRSMVQDAVMRWFPNLKQEVDQDQVFPNSPYAKFDSVANRKIWNPIQILGRLEQQDELLAKNPLSNSNPAPTNNRSSVPSKNPATGNQQLSSQSSKPKREVQQQISKTKPTIQQNRPNPFRDSQKTFSPNEQAVVSSGKPAKPSSPQSPIQITTQPNLGAVQNQGESLTGDVLAQNPLSGSFQTQRKPNTQTQPGSSANPFRKPPKPNPFRENSGNSIVGNSNQQGGNAPNSVSSNLNSSSGGVPAGNQNQQQISKENSLQDTTGAGNIVGLPPVNQSGKVLAKNPFLSQNSNSSQPANGISRKQMDSNQNNGGLAAANQIGSSSHQRKGALPRNGKSRIKSGQENTTSLPPLNEGELLQKNLLSQQTPQNKKVTQPNKNGAEGSGQILPLPPVMKQHGLGTGQPKTNQSNKIVKNKDEANNNGSENGSKESIGIVKANPQTISQQPSTFTKENWGSLLNNMSKKDGWLRDDRQYSIRYHASGHEDTFLRSWLELAVSQNGEPKTTDPFNRITKPLMKEIGTAHSVGNCMQCHNPTSPMQEKQTVLALLGLPTSFNDDGQESALAESGRSSQPNVIAASDSSRGASSKFSLVSSKLDDTLKKLADKVERTEGLSPGVGSNFSSKWVHWKGVYRDPLVRGFTKFSHRPHLIVGKEGGCSSCHQMDPKAAEPGHDFTRFSDFKPITLKSCAVCHREGGSSNDCSTCHNYHVGSQIKTTGKK